MQKKFFLNLILSGFLISLSALHSASIKDQDAPDSSFKGFKGNSTKSAVEYPYAKFIDKEGRYNIVDQFRRYYYPKKKLLFGDRLTELSFGGSIKADYYSLRHASTLNKDIEGDAKDQFRQRSEFTAHFSHKMDEYRTRPVAFGQITLGNTFFWEPNYLPYNLPEQVGTSLLDFHGLTYSPYRLNIQEAWLAFNFDQLFSNRDRAKLSLKVGVFPFLIGRGVSLGDWFDGGSYIYGFTKLGVQTHAPMYAPGILVSGGMWDGSFNYDLYYSPAVSEEATPEGSGRSLSTIKERLGDRHIVAGRIVGVSDFYENSKTWLEPYFVYYKSPRTSIRTNYDSSLRMLTLGFMADHKAAGFEVNFEAARQFGKMKNRPYINQARPNQEYFINQNVDGSKGFVTNAPNNNANLKMPVEIYGSQGNNSATDITVAGKKYQPLPLTYQDWNGFNKALSELSYHEYHPERESTLAGRMAMLDIKYTFDNYPLSVALAFGYFSGDKDPLNDSVDKFFASNSLVKPSGSEALQTFKHFLPLRDYHYTGLWAAPMVMVNAGVVPRPYNLNYSYGEALNESDTLTNLIYLVGGFKFSPSLDYTNVTINPNIAVYWNNVDIPVWSTTEPQPAMVALEQSLIQADSPVLSYKRLPWTDQDYGYQKLVGWEGSATASNFLGWEMNCLIGYQVSKDIDVLIKMAVFFPGQHYTDIKSMPNQNTKLVENIVDSLNGGLSKKTYNPGLGSDAAYGLNLRIGYTF